MIHKPQTRTTEVSLTTNIKTDAKFQEIVVYYRTLQEHSVTNLCLVLTS